MADLIVYLPFVNSLQSLFGSVVSPTFVPFALLFSVVISGITLFGAFQGLRAWLNWVETRQRVELDIDWLAPVVNIILDASHLSWYVLMCATGSALVAITFPISVPILVGCCGKSRPAEEEEPMYLRKRR